MGLYERMKELYEKTEKENMKERERQQRETQLRRDASRVAETLQAHGVKAEDSPIRGWLLYTVTQSPPPQSEPGHELIARRTSDVTTVRYYLGADSTIYANERPIEHLGDATIDAIGESLAKIAVENHLNPELFRDDDIQIFQIVKDDDTQG